MRVLMLVATAVATDTRVLREASSLVAAGHQVHIIGKQVPAGYQPPPGITVSSAGAGSVFRAEGTPSLTGRRLPAWQRGARWLLLPQHRNSAFARWAAGAAALARDEKADVVHAHDFTALELGSRLAAERGVPLVYDSHELWSGRPRVGRPTPWQRRRERRVEGRLGRRATAVITVGEGVAAALQAEHGWSDVLVVHNSFPLDRAHEQGQPTAPQRLIYAGRLAPYRELEVIAAASRQLPLPVDLIGPADTTWLAGFDPGRAQVLPPRPVDEVTVLLRAAGAALITHSDRWANHRLAMPNKLFHAVAAGVPVVGTDVGELARIVRANGLGTLYRPGDRDDLTRAVNELLSDYAQYRDAVRAAADRLSWSADERVLIDLYARLDAARTLA